MRAGLRIVGLLLCAIAFGATASASGQNRATSVGVGETAPDFTLTDQNGRKHTLSAQRGKRAVVLVFYRGHW